MNHRPFAYAQLAVATFSLWAFWLTGIGYALVAFVLACVLATLIATYSYQEWRYRSREREVQKMLMQILAEARTAVELQR